MATMNALSATILLTATACTSGKTVDSGNTLVDSGHTNAPATSGDLTVLTYNVHGLPAAITGDDTPARMVDIGPKIADWDIVGIQEDFDSDNHQTLMDGAQPVDHRWFDDTLEGRFYGSGLSVLATPAIIDHQHTHFSACHGITDASSDCLASKGFQAVRLAVGETSIDVYNTHLEAGGGEEDNAARQIHVDEILASLSGWSAGQAVIFTGDFNLRPSDAADGPLIAQLVNEAGLTQACTALDCPEADHIDKILFRSSDEIALTATSWANNASDFQSESGTDLSDHPPLSATIRWNRH
jgi:endonuclease/exonuclease/phosphatase family metal-dependent hydrolase